jgi:hypothetical protein
MRNDKHKVHYYFHSDFPASAFKRAVRKALTQVSKLVRSDVDVWMCDVLYES